MFLNNDSYIELEQQVGFMTWIEKSCTAQVAAYLPFVMGMEAMMCHVNLQWPTIHGHTNYQT